MTRKGDCSGDHFFKWPVVIEVATSPSTWFGGGGGSVVLRYCVFKGALFELVV